MKEVAVISGKGGTGKTSIVACFAALAKKAAIADCDVDAADLHLILEPTIIQREKFSGGSPARIMPGHCTACGKCKRLCQSGAIAGMKKVPHTIDREKCIRCGACIAACEFDAIMVL